MKLRSSLALYGSLKRARHRNRPVSVRSIPLVAGRESGFRAALCGQTRCPIELDVVIVKTAASLSNTSQPLTEGLRREAGRVSTLNDE